MSAAPRRGRSSGGHSIALSDRSEARYVTHGSSNYLSENCPKNWRRTEVSATLQLAALVPSVGTTLANRYSRET